MKDIKKTKMLLSLSRFDSLGLIGRIVGSILVLGFIGIMVFVCLRGRGNG